MADKEKKKTIVVDGKEYNLEDFDDTKEWTSLKKKLEKRKVKK